MTSEFSNIYYPNKVSSVSSLQFLWEEVKANMEPLLDEIKIYDKPKSRLIENQITRMDKIIAIFGRTKKIKFSSDDVLKDSESDFFSNRTNDLKNWIINLLEIFISNSQIQKEDPESIIKLWNKFKKLNLEIRYQNDSNFIEAKQNNHNDDWARINSHKLLIVYDGALFSIQKMRNFSIHYTTGITNSILTKLSRDVSDPLTNCSGAGSIMVLSGQTMGLIYCFVEIVQAWIDTCKVKKAGGLKGSTRFVPRSS